MQLQIGEDTSLSDPKLAQISNSERPDPKSDSREEKEAITTQLSPSLPAMTTYPSYGTPHSSPSYSEDPSKFIENDKSKVRTSNQKAASPLVIQWLQDNYDACEGTSLPRSTLYAHYVSYCGSMNIEPVNAASFGKLIRSVFPFLKTRRLGTRGHSKYHYYGIQIKSNSDLRLPAFQIGESFIGSKSKPQSNPKKELEERKSPLSFSFEREGFRNGNSYEMGSGPIPGVTPVQLPDFTFEPLRIPAEMTGELNHFMITYRQHCQTLVDVAFKQQFQEIEKILRHFWQSVLPSMRNLLQRMDVIELILQKDQLTYKMIAHVLLPNVLQALPVSIPQAIRQFAKNLEIWLASALEGLPQEFSIRKLHVTKKFSQSLHKQASLNHLTQAARNVLQNTSQVQQMIVDWNRLDFEFIRDQASWICRCGDEIIQSAQEDFKRFLTERASLEQWASWLQEIVQKVLGKCNDPQELIVIAQQLLLKWSFYSTLIIRDLTIRNASSFSSFHLLRTLFDEYIFYLVDSKFAAIIQHPPYETPPVHNNHSFDPFAIDSQVNKDIPRMGKHLPYPFPDSSERLPIQHDDDYSRYDINYEGTLPQQYRSPSVFRTYPNKTMDDRFSGGKRPLQQVYNTSSYPTSFTTSSITSSPASSSASMESIIHANNFESNEKKPRTTLTSESTPPAEEK